MANQLTWLIYSIDYILRKKSVSYRKHRKYCKYKYVQNEDASLLLSKALLKDEPFMAGRYGYSEVAVMRMYEFKKKNKYEKVINQLYEWSGFFPNDILLGNKFLQTMISASEQVDILGASNQLCENYFINRYMSKDVIVSENFGFFDFFDMSTSWTEALEGKRVLIVSPFSQSVKSQYAKRELIFKGTNILPKFDLQTYQSLLTVGDMADSRFKDWFEALEFMKKEILAMDFDVAILGCGAYGFPLAAEIKKAGKQAIHMGGVFQLLFGIMGKRWDGSRFGGIEKMPESIAKYYNEHWTYPIEEKPKEAEKVEYGPYWG